MTLSSFGSKIMNLLGVFRFSLSQKSVSGHQIQRVCVELGGMSANAVYAVFSHFCCVGGFGDLSDTMVPTLRGATGDVVTVYRVQKHVFCSL